MTPTSLQQWLSQSQHLMFLIDDKATILDSNAQAQDQLNYAADDLTARNMTVDLIAPPHRALFEHIMNQLRKRQSSHRVNLNLQTKQGHLIAVTAHVFIQLNNELNRSASPSILMICSPVQSLVAHESEPERMLALSVDMLGISDLEGRFIHLNAAWQHTLGYDTRQLLHQSYLEFIHPNDIQHTQTVLQEAIANDDLQRTQLENRYITKDGQIKWLAWRFTVDPHRDQIYFVARDVTARKQTELELLMRNEALEHSPSGISIADARSTDMPLIYINPAFEKITGYAVSEAIGRNCRFLQGTDREQEGIQTIRQAIQSEQSAQVVIRNYRKDGTLFYNELSIAPIHDIHGTLTHYVGISTDVTERMQAQAQITQKNQALIQANEHLAQARKQAEEATRLKSQFLATMSHELRTPLNAIIGYTEIQLAGMTGTLSDEQHDYQTRILKNADHLLMLINDILDISKIEAGRTELINKPFILDDLLQTIHDQMAGLAAEKSLRLNIERDTRLPDRLMGDPERIKQILINLLSNAIKFTQQGHIQLLVRQYGRDAWELIVEDSGIGIAPHMQEVIFEEFRQVDNSSSRSIGGTGLGLTIVRKLALMMGGNIRLKSQLREGSTFTIILPLIAADQQLV